MPYEGSKSHIATYNFCYLCKERLDTYHDDQDEGWYFVDTRQVRFAKSLAPAAGAGEQLQAKNVVNVHTSCLKEIEELSFAQTEGHKKAAKQLEQESGANTATNDQTLELPLAGQKRIYVDANLSEVSRAGEPDVDLQMKGLQDIIRGLESQKRRKLDV